MKRHQHYWLETGIPHSLFLINRLFLWECAVCDKKKYFKTGRVPVNPIVPSAWEVYESELAKGHAHFIMSPPLIFGNEQERSIGQRYKQLMEAAP